MKSVGLLLVVSLCCGATALAVSSEVDRCNVVWDSPSKNSLGSMPIGNGDIAANVWVEPSGDLVLLLSKTDAFDEFNRLLKIGRIRIQTTPALAGTPFIQALRLESGSIEITRGGMQARVWADANHAVIQVDLRNDRPIEVTVTNEIWRTAPRVLNRVAGGEQEAHSAYGNRPEFLRVNPDIVLPRRVAQIAWCHHNAESMWKANLELTALGAEAAQLADPLLRRTFGAVVRAAGLKAVSDTALQTTKPVKSLSIQIFPLTKTARTPAAWLKAAEAQANRIKGTTEQRFTLHRRWWDSFWKRSWIVVTGSPEAADVSQAYALQRYVTTCAGRGALPIKFNGSVFTVDQVFDPDYRRWGGPYWWQNTRLPYWSMLSAGDYDQMLPLFQMYMDTLPLRKAATKKYYGHAGAYFPETMTFWGNFAEKNYGLDRSGKPDGLTDNLYIRRYWQGGLELVGMMLDYYDHTQDMKFRDKTLLPLAKEITTFFDQHWKRGADGKVFYSPAQSLETFWNVANPTPEIAGLRYLLPRLLALPVDDATKTAWRNQLADQPEIPMLTTNNATRILPAKTYSVADKKNVENPELYAVFPYRLHTVLAGDDACAIGINTWNARRNHANIGWQQQPIQAALLGLTHEAKALIFQRARDKAAGYRFPGFYGPNYDWTPDQDQISVFQIGLQRMLMQCEGSKILLLPAWPKDWNVAFKLHAPYQTTVEGVWRNGKLEQLKVSPAERQKDVVIWKETDQ